LLIKGYKEGEVKEKDFNFIRTPTPEAAEGRDKDNQK
jgi:hypothetical protein